ncbi:MAG: RnfH family protein [Nitrosomonas sp.]|nr:MAG: RnfH family protein [Nitrosomonas sp.]
MVTVLVEVVYALPQFQISKQLEVPGESTVMQAILLSGLLDQFPEIDLEKNKVGIFGRLIQPDRPVHPYDRIEIYRPLIIDPKEARRIRAGQSAGVER